MDLENIIPNEVSQNEKDKYHMIYCLYVESFKNDTSELMH